MNKKFLPLVISAGLVSALLLFLGTALMDRLAPVYASRLPALLAGKSSSSISEMSSSQGTSTIEVTLKVTEDASSTPRASGTDDQPGQDDQPGRKETPQPQSTPMPANQPARAVTIAELSANPSAYRGMLVSLSGVATNLDGDKFLLNDGTGQIIIDLEDDLVKVVVANGSQVTVLGQFKVRNDGIEVDACVYNDGSGNIQVDACENEHRSGSSTSTPDDHGGRRDDRGSATPDDHGGQNSGSGSSSSGSDDNSGSGKSGSDDNSGSNSGSGKSGKGSGN